MASNGLNTNSIYINLYIFFTLFLHNIQGTPRWIERGNLIREGGNGNQMGKRDTCAMRKLKKRVSYPSKPLDSESTRAQASRGLESRGRMCISTCLYIFAQSLHIHTLLERMHACIQTYMHSCLHAYMHTCTPAYKHTCMPACMHACIHNAYFIRRLRSA